MEYLAVGNDELEDAPKLEKTIKCYNCNKRHRIKYGEEILCDGTKIPSKNLAFFKCGEDLYLAGINGKEWRPNEKRTRRKIV